MMLEEKANIRGWICFLGFMITSGCSLYRDPKVPSLPTPCYFKYAVPTSNKSLSYYWWENFKDAALTDLVNLALRNNYNYQATLKNIQIAKTYVTQYQSGLFPEVSLIFNASRNKFSQNAVINDADALNVNSIQTGAILPTGTTLTTSGRPFNAFQLEGSVTYELDVWNRIRNQVKQAKADVGTSEANAQVVRTSLIANVVTTYFQINTLNTTVVNLKKQVQVAEEKFRLLQSQYRAGLIEVTALMDAKNTLETIKNNLTLQEKQRQGLQNTLAYLVGEYPETFCLPCRVCLASFQFHQLIPPGIPCQVLANRPDIRSRFFQILSYGYLEKQTLADFLPSFSLTANDGFSSAHLHNLFSGASNFWNFGIMIAQPIFDAGKRASVHKRAKLQYEQAALNYKDTVVKAFQEVNTALSAYQQDRIVLSGYERQAMNEEVKLRASSAQYQSGVADYMAHLNNQLTFLQIQYGLINQRRIVIEDVIQTYKSMGLGL